MSSSAIVKIMRDEDEQRRKLKRLEEQRERVNLRLEQQRRHVDKRFDRARERILHGGQSPNVSQQRIIDAALDLLDEDGLNELSMRKLARRLDMQAPALYWHFKNKEVLIDYMAEAILRAEFAELEPRRPDEAWQDWLITNGKRLRKAMKSHRDGARIVAGAHLYPAVTLMRIFEVSMESLTSAGMDLQKANLLITTAVHFIFGNVIEEQASPTLEEIKNAISGPMMKDYPLMAKSVQKSYAEALAGYDEFEDSLRLIINHPD